MKKVWLYTSKIVQDEKHLEALVAKLPTKDQEKISSLKSLESKLCSTYGRHLLKMAAGAIFACPDVLDALEIDEYGKPFLKDSKFVFNISHSGEYVVCAIGNSDVIGVDIEKPRPTKTNVFERVFSEKERGMLERSENQNLLFRQFWTRKEAVVKALGKGISMGLTQFDVIEGRIDYEGTALHLFDIELPNDFVGAICSDYNISEIELKTIKL